MEVLRGPQGALFGKNTAAGAINIVTAGPTDTFEGSATAAYDFSLSGIDLSGYVSGPVSDSLSARLAVKVLDDDGYIVNKTTGDKNPRQKERLARLSLKYEPQSNFDVSGKVEYSETRTDGENSVIGSLTVPGQVENVQYADGDPFGYRDGAYVSAFNSEATANYRFSDLTMTSVTGFSSFYANRANSYSQDVPAIFLNRVVEKFQQASEEVRLTSPEHQTFSYIVGGYFDWSRNNIATPWIYNLVDGLVAGSVNSQFAQTTQTYSAFAQGTYSITDDFRLIGSLRYTLTDKSGSFYTKLVSGVPLSALTSDAAAISEGHLDPSLTAQYDLTNSMMLYATYGRGSKSGGFIADTPGTPQSGFVFKPEESTNYEVGLKSTFANDTVLLDASLYDTTIRNLQTSVFDPSDPGGFVTKNAASATSKGVETVLGWRPVDSLQLSLNGAYQDAHYDNFPGANCLARQPLSQCDPSAPPSAPNSIANNNLAGVPLTYSSKWTGNVQATHTLPLPHELQLVTTLKAAYRSKFYNSDDQSLIYGVQDGFVKLDGRLQVGDTDDRWDVALVGKNLTDAKTYSFSNAWPFPLTNYPQATKYLDEPRTIALELTYRF
jgi:iron complex outermembrane receptor protein